MVSVKTRTIKGNTYVYVSATASYRGERKTFEKMVGRKTDDKPITERIEFYSYLMSFKADLYRMYLQMRDTKLLHLSRECAMFLVLLPSFYRRYLANLYPSELEKYRRNFDVRHIHNTTAIEGNTITLKETAMMLDHNLSPRSKELREIHEIENYTRVLHHARGHKGKISKRFILKLHELIQRNIDDNTAGNFRRINVGISGSKWEPGPAIFVEEEIDNLLKWYENEKKRMHPFELAGIFHHRFCQIHPFVDGNGRMARELHNFILVKNGFPPITVPVERRDEYMDYLERADEGDMVPLLRFFFELLVYDYVRVVMDAIMQEREKISTVVKDMDPELPTVPEMGEFLNVVIWFFGLLGELYGEVPALGDITKFLKILEKPERLKLEMKLAT